jgi:hypothetical protein
MNNEAPVPFVARSRKLLSTPAPAGPEHRYDSNMQIWVCARTGEPLVLLRTQQDGRTLAASEFGETTLTKTVEGADQSEGRVDASFASSGYRGVSASQFGETTLTESGEGADQAERTVGT